jgi:uncharacterized membrane protein SpoIIM required for sporulation
MRIDDFVSRRQPRWDQLERLLEHAERTTDAHLGRAKLQELIHLYREACSDLNKARSHTANPEILDRLNSLTGRAYRFIYRGSGEQNVAASIRKLIFEEIPRTFRRERTYVMSAASALLLGALVGLVAVLTNPVNGERLIPSQFFSESPRDRVEGIESRDERIQNVGDAALFGAELYTHNIRVSFLAFSLGAITIVGAYLLLFYNGVILGAVAAMYYIDGVHVFFFAWVGPHGALELPAIVFGAAAGIYLGHAFLFPGEMQRAASLRRAFPVVWRMMVATALTLVLAGLIEGSFSQFSAKTFPYALKIAVSVALFCGLIALLFLARLPEERT